MTPWTHRKSTILSERASKTMRIYKEIYSFDELCPWIIWIQRAPGLLGGGTPSRPYYARPMLTWRRVLRTSIGISIGIGIGILGALPLGEGEGCEALSSRSHRKYMMTIMSKFIIFK